MANIAITASDVAPVRMDEKLTGPAAEAIDAGEFVRLDTTNGQFTLANATSAAEGRVIGIAVNSAVAGETLTVMKRGLVDLGDALTAQTIDEQFLLSDTDGKIDDGAGAPTGSYPVGRCVPAWGATTADKILAVDIAV